MKLSNNRLIWFIVKPSATQESILEYFEDYLKNNSFQVLWVNKKSLSEPEVDAIHCVVWPWKCNESEYKKYMTSDYTIGYLVMHDTLHDEKLFEFWFNLRGDLIDASACSDLSLRKIIHEKLIGSWYLFKSSVENHLHVTDSKQELESFLKIYFPQYQIDNI